MDMVLLGQRIRESRKAMGLTQAQLAEKIDMSTSFLGHVERGTRVLSVDTLRKLCIVLEVSADDLLGVYDKHPREYLQPEWSEQRCAQVLRLLQDASHIVSAMK